MTPVQGVQVPWVWQKCPYSENEFIYYIFFFTFTVVKYIKRKALLNFWYVVQRLIWIPQINTRLTGSRRKKPQPCICFYYSYNICLQHILQSWQPIFLEIHRDTYIHTCTSINLTVFFVNKLWVYMLRRQYL